LLEKCPDQQANILIKNNPYQMKNLKKISRAELKNIKGGEDPISLDCNGQTCYATQYCKLDCEGILFCARKGVIYPPCN